MLARLRQILSARPSKTEPTILKPPFRRFGALGWISAAPSGGDDHADPYRSELCLLENGTKIPHGHTPHWMIDRVGGGRFSHWKKWIFFSTLDGSDPNSNGRVYAFDFSLDQKTWDRERRARSATRWGMHRRGTYFVERGGDLCPPPLTCNIGLTNKCNLRCEICGSQKHLDVSGVRRRHMALKTFEAVAETIFPFLSVVELNSQGDPLLHPNIEVVLSRIAEHGCDVKIQHNGTLLTDAMVDLLCRQHGTLMLSLDAVGVKFDEVRRGGSWEKAVTGLTRLLKERDPKRLSVGVYPTLTQRTIGEAENVLAWSAEHGVDVVTFHRYVPVTGSFEAEPAVDEYERFKGRMRQWCADHADPLMLYFESENLNRRLPTERRTEYASLEKAAALAGCYPPTFPTEADNPVADSFLTCTAPRDYVEIGLEGQVGACCRAQDVPLGYATSVEAFADAWLGTNYDKIRRSLLRGATGPYPLPNCEGCMKFFAPVAAGKRSAVDYSAQADWREKGLFFDSRRETRIEEIRREQGHCNIAIIPPGLDVADLELWEDDQPLGPSGTLHDEIRSLGGGRYHIGARSVNFSTSDGTDAQRNQRIYVLRPKVWQGKQN